MIRPFLMSSLFVAVSLVAAPAIAGAEGEGEGEGEPEGCGDITIQGQCEGSVVSYCVQDQLVVIDCGDTEVFPEGTICEEITAEYGFDCSLPQGEVCAGTNQQGDLVHLPCQGDEAGCVIDSEGGPGCATGVGTCAFADVGTCSGSVFTLSCAGLGSEQATNGQPLIIDCADFPGSTCTANAGCLFAPGEACVDGGACGTSSADAVACPASGTCPEANAGEGEGEASEGEGEDDDGDEDEDEGGLNCASAGLVGATPALLLALGLVKLGRRRRA